MSQQILIIAIEEKKDTVGALLWFLSELGDCTTQIYKSGQEALENVSTSNPNLILFAHHLSGEDPIGLFSQMIQICPQARTIVSLPEDGSELAEEYIKAGASECLIRDHHFQSGLRHSVKQAVLELTAANDRVMSAFEKGDTVLHYRILEDISGWGIGEVYKAQDLQTRRNVALSVLPPGILGTEEEREQFLNKAAVAQQIDHANLAAIYGAEESGQLIFLASEYVRGESLREWIDSGYLGVVPVIDLGAQIADALEAIHKRGLVHRDVKPSNIRITSKNQAKLLFSISPKKIPGVSVKNAGLPMDLVQYMSPEQVRSEAIDARSDIFSLASILYHAFTGQPPFKSTDSLSVMLDIVSEEHAAPSTVKEGLPKDLDRILGTALSKNPADRYESAYDFSFALLELKVALTQNLTPDEPEPEPEEKITVATEQPQVKSGHKWYALIVVLLLLTAGAAFYFNRQSQQIETPTLAVLPFSNTVANNYLPDGITEAVIHNLARSSSIQVISQNTMFRFRNTNLAPKDIGESLKVRFVLFGKITGQQTGSDLHAELLDMKTGNIIWTMNFKIENPFQVGQHIASQVRSRLGVAPSSIVEIEPDSIAYELYLEGRSYYRKKNIQDIHRSLELYKSALAADPNSTILYEGIAESWLMLASRFHEGAEAYLRAKEAATKAISIDPSSANAHLVRGVIDLIYEWDFDASEQELRSASNLQPNNATAHAYLALLFAATERQQEAFTEVQKALRIDPLSTEVNNELAWALVQIRKYPEAIEVCQKSIQWNADAAAIYLTLGDAYLGSGNNSEAMAAYRRAADLGAPSAALRTVLVMAASGMKTESRLLLKSIEKQPKQDSLSPDYVAAACATVGRMDEALQWLHKAFEARTPALIMLKVDPAFDPLRTDPRFQHMARAIGIPREPSQSQMDGVPRSLLSGNDDHT